MAKFPVYLISDDISISEVLKLYCSENDNLADIAQFSDSQNLLDNIKQQEKSIAIIDLSLNVEQKLDLILKISNEFKNCKILALSDNPTVDLLIRVMRAGAKEFIPVPIIKKEFNEIIDKFTTQFTEQKVNNKCKIISVFSNKGGIGKTSLATNLALELANITNENVALIDMNFQMGDITTFLDLKPSFNISYMLENIDKINDTFLLSTLEKYKQSNLYILADPPFFKQADNIQPKQITKLFETLKQTFSYIIVDAEASFDGKNIAALDNSDLILLVTVANLPALRNTQRCLELFDKLGYDKNKTQIVINRYMENDEIKISDVEKVLQKEIYWKVPNNYFAIMSSINKGVPVCAQNPATNIAQSYNGLAQYISDNLYKQKLVKRFEKIFNDK